MTKKIKGRIILISLIALFATIVISKLISWWIIVPLGIVLGYWSGVKPIQAFSIGFFSIFAAWFLEAYWINEMNQSILSQKIGQVMVGINPLGLLLMTGALGGLGGGLSFGLGASVRNASKKEMGDES